MRIIGVIFLCLVSGVVGGLASQLLIRHTSPLPINSTAFNLIDEASGRQLASLKSVVQADADSPMALLTFYDQDEKATTFYGIKGNRPVLMMADHQQKPRVGLMLDEAQYPQLFMYNSQTNPVLSLGLLSENSHGLFFSGPNGEGRIILSNIENQVGLELYHADETPFWRMSEYLEQRRTE